MLDTDSKEHQKHQECLEKLNIRQEGALKRYHNRGMLNVGPEEYEGANTRYLMELELLKEEDYSRSKKMGLAVVDPEKWGVNVFNIYDTEHNILRCPVYKPNYYSSLIYVAEELVMPLCRIAYQLNYSEETKHYQLVILEGLRSVRMDRLIHNAQIESRADYTDSFMDIMDKEKIMFLYDKHTLFQKSDEQVEKGLITPLGEKTFCLAPFTRGIAVGVALWDNRINKFAVTTASTVGQACLMSESEEYNTARKENNALHTMMIAHGFLCSDYPLFKSPFVLNTHEQMKAIFDLPFNCQLLEYRQALPHFYASMCASKSTIRVDKLSALHSHSDSIANHSLILCEDNYKVFPVICYDGFVQELPVVDSLYEKFVLLEAHLKNIAAVVERRLKRVALNLSTPFTDRGFGSFLQTLLGEKEPNKAREEAQMQLLTLQKADSFGAQGLALSDEEGSDEKGSTKAVAARMMKNAGFDVFPEFGSNLNKEDGTALYMKIDGISKPTKPSIPSIVVDDAYLESIRGLFAEEELNIGD